MDSSYRPRGGGGGYRQMGGKGGRPMIPKPDRGLYDGKSKRPMIVRKAVDFQSDAITYVVNRVYKERAREYPCIQPSEAFVKSMLPPAALSDQPTSSITGRYIHKAHNKIPHPTFVLAWTLDGRRLFTGNSAGEITMWDGKTFNFTNLVSTGRNEAVRALTWSHSGDFLLTGDGGGFVGYFEPTLKPLYAMQSHRKAIRGLCFGPTDSKFVSCSDDSTLAIWDFATRKSEAVLEGHNWDVRCVDWHPYNSLIVSGAKDKLIKLWDAKSKTNLHTWQGHKGDVTKVVWNANGNWFLSSSRDYSMRIFDIRMMKELQVIRGNGEICSVAWHPYHEKLFSSGDANGDISFWISGLDSSQGKLFNAHNSAIWDMKWHPFGHILCASGNDCYTSFWCRNRPGEKMEDRYNDPYFVPPPSKMELEAQAHAQAMAASGQSSGGEASISFPLLNPSDDFLSSQKQLIIPGAVGSASMNWEPSSATASVLSELDFSSAKLALGGGGPIGSPFNGAPGIKKTFSILPPVTLGPSQSSSSTATSTSSGSASTSTAGGSGKSILTIATTIPGLGQLTPGMAVRAFSSNSAYYPQPTGSAAMSGSAGAGGSAHSYGGTASSSLPSSGYPNNAIQRARVDHRRDNRENRYSDRSSGTHDYDTHDGRPSRHHHNPHHHQQQQQQQQYGSKVDDGRRYDVNGRDNRYDSLPNAPPPSSIPPSSSSSLPSTTPYYGHSPQTVLQHQQQPYASGSAPMVAPPPPLVGGSYPPHYPLQLPKPGAYPPHPPLPPVYPPQQGGYVAPYR